MWLINEEMERQRGRVSRREYGMEDLRYDIELVAFFLSTLAIFILSMLNKLELHLCDNLFGIVIAFITIIIVIAVGCCCCL